MQVVWPLNFFRLSRRLARWRGGLSAWAVLGLVACSSVAPPPAPSGPAAPKPSLPSRPAAPAPEPRPPVPPPPPPLAAESRWLTELFGATPVRVRDEADGSVLVQVPMVHAFEGAGASPKPAMKAVLDRLSQSLLRQPTARLMVEAPAPSSRAAALRAHLTGRGIAAWRVGTTVAAAEAPAVLLRLQPGAASVLRLDDASLPPPAAGTVRPAPAAKAPGAQGQLRPAVR